MASSSVGTHEPMNQLKPETVDMHRALASLMEELEAIDWYRQRIEAASDGQLKAILEHNMDEEIEHACMVLEWLRRTEPKFDVAMKMYLFTTGDITRIEEKVEAGGKEEEKAAETALRKPRTTIGDMKGK